MSVELTIVTSMNPTIERELEKLGLSEKEAKVYLAALELGAQPVQDIARKAGVNRATAYVMIEGLTQRGLMTSFDRGKKRLFGAEPPDRLLSIIRVKERELEEREREFSQVLPELRAILASSGERPRVRFFEGAEGIRSLREEILATDADELVEVVESEALVPGTSSQEDAEHQRRLREKGVRGRVLVTSDRVLDEVRVRPVPNFEFRKVGVQQFPIRGQLAVFGPKIFAYTQSGKLIGAVIESEALATTLKSIFLLAWRCASPAK